MSESRQCNHCSKNFHQDDGMLNILEILECSDQEVEQWQQYNSKTKLEDWFCMDCVSTIIPEIEGEH